MLGELCQPGAGCTSWGTGEGQAHPSVLQHASLLLQCAWHGREQKVFVSWLNCRSCFPVGLYLSAFPPLVRTGSLLICHGKKPASASADLTQFLQVSTKSKPQQAEELLFIQTGCEDHMMSSEHPFTLFYKKGLVYPS